MKNSFKQWLYLSSQIQTDVQVASTLICPKCGKQTIAYVYVGDTQSRIGFMQIWCNTCFHGVYISRVKVPENAEMLTYDITPEELEKRVPKFTQVTPY